MLISFLILQFILLLFMALHDWVAIPPFNDVNTLKKVDSISYRLMGTIINVLSVLIPFILTVLYCVNSDMNLFQTIIVFYCCLSLGTILSWWVPYMFGSSQKHKERFMKFKQTHHFLPPRGDHVIPNTLHVILHIQVWACLILSILFYLA